MKYCNNCRQLVEPIKKFNTIAFLLLCCCTCFGWIIYLIYYGLKASKCPMCNSINWGVKPVVQSQFTPQISSQVRFCPNCGANINPEDDFCIQCGKKT